MTAAPPTVRPKVIFFAPILEYPPASGGQISVANAVIVLHQICELHIVTTVPIDGTQAVETERFFRAHCHALVQAPTARMTARTPWFGTALRRLRRLAAPVYAAVDARFLARYGTAHGVNIYWVDRVLEHAFSVFAQLRRLCPNALIVADTCAVYSRFVLRELPLISNPLRWLWIRRRGTRKEREERVLTRCANVVTAVSELDAQYFRSIAPEPSRIKLFSNTIDLERYRIGELQRAHLQRPRVLLLGAFGHPNSPMDRAAKWMAEEIMPRVRREVPDAHLDVVGRNADKTQAGIRSDKVSVVGHVPSVIPFLRKATVTVVPIRYESGTRFKILESGAASVPCVSTTLGAEGIGITDKENILIADSTEDFAAAVVQVLRDAKYARALGDRLHELVAARYSLDAQKREGQEIIQFLRERSVTGTR